ncbi:sugar ABC transporter ATP-binding protein [Kineococcus rhizosphaerae]|uniref:Monosaccharide ABC transporter ATP-binding protein (CUT2 family) n=1 Tax=Kineococcus rhizosphaerae TaxID=559628 RepID=A0A2T0R8H0_9ACTN|nr:sugar ABC transporter ATP-binding protein [Kineococcus rhizosphaerae]PRY17471.1 monosaccharide ABC transporter ATP-binding protein (CUT2 family) [Kineococcus rhizosphaerae]
MTAPAIRLSGLSKTFGAQRALDDVTLEIPAGTVHGLLGENGSGKSTLIKVLTGVHEPDPGARLEVRGREVDLPLPPGAFRDLGISVVHQDLGLLPDLSVAENMRIAQGIAARRAVVSWRTERRLAGQTLRRHGLDIDPAAPVATLSDTERALVAILRAVDELGEHRTLLILDEPTVFLPREGTDLLFRVVADLVADGSTSVLLVSHDLTEVLDHTHAVTVLRDGRVAGTVESATTDPAGLTELIVGADLAAAVRRHAVSGPAAPERPVAGRGRVQVAALTSPRLAGISFDVARGEVLGLTGLAGSGYAEVLPALYGAGGKVSGDLLVDRDALQLSTLTPSRALATGVVHVPADRRRDGGIAEESVERNVTMPVMTTLGTRFRLDRTALRRRAAELCRAYDVRPFDPGKAFGTLSGGNQQKAVLAKWLQTDPRVVLLAEPTQGIDVGAKAFVFDLLRRTAERGASILLASSDYEQLATVCDRVLVLARGHVVAELSGADLNQAVLSDRVLSSTRLLPGPRPHPTALEREAS